jgi:hypothetical protein
VLCAASGVAIRAAAQADVANKYCLRAGDWGLALICMDFSLFSAISTIELRISGPIYAQTD